MKKTMFAVLCLAMTAITCVANNTEKSAKSPNDRPRQERIDPIINMNIVSQMGLSDKQVKQIEALKDKKHEEMKNLHPKKHHDGKSMAQKERKKMQKDQRKEHRTKVQAINEKYRKELQNIMGTKTYVTYVEKVNDQLAMRYSFQGRHPKKNMHKMTRRQHVQHGRMQQHGMQQKTEKA